VKGPLRVGVVGLGRWATAAHLPALAEDPRWEIAALADSDPQRREEAGGLFPAARTFPDLPAMLRERELDVVDICTPHRTHRELALAAIAAGKHVLCEKPLALTLDDAREMAGAAETAGVRTAVCFTFRHAPGVRALKDLLEAGRIGRVYHVQGFEQNSLFHDPLVPRPASWAEERGHSGALGEYASHLVDLVRWLVGDFVEVAADLRTFVPERLLVGRGMAPSGVDDAAAFLARLEGGVQGLLQASWVAAGRPPGVELRIFGERGALWLRLVEGPEGVERLWAADIADGLFEPVPIPDAVPRDAGGDWPRLYLRRLVGHVGERLLAGQAPEGDFEDGWRSQAILDAVHLAAQERRWVALAELTG